jgi:hypothetical protein
LTTLGIFLEKVLEKAFIVKTTFIQGETNNFKLFSANLLELGFGLL